MRFGIIGTNFVTDWLLQAGRQCDGFALTTVYSRDLERARVYAKANGAAYATDSLEVLANSPHVDAVYIASPTALHCEQAVRMLSAGKHVLCEKPVASSRAALEAMLAAASSGAVVMEAMRPAYSPALSRLQAVMPEIGVVRRAGLSMCKISSRYDKFRAGEVLNAFNPALANGALMDLGVYCVHVMLRLFGAPANVQAACVKLHNGIEASGTILASYTDKVVSLEYSKITDDRQACAIHGEDGSIYFSDVSTLRDIRLARRGADMETIENPVAEHDMVYELEAFMRLAQSPADMRRENAYSLEAMRILDAVRKQCDIRFAPNEVL